MKSLLSSPRRRGAALIAVLWLVALLSVVIFSVSALLMEDTRILGRRGHELEALCLAEKGFAIGTHPNVTPKDPLLRTLDENGDGWEVTIRGEDGRLNINALLQRDDLDLLRSLFVFHGLGLPEAETLAQTLADWVDADDDIRPKGAERRAYESNFKPYNRPFRSLEEMTEVIGMEQLALVWPGWRSAFSLDAGNSLDLNEAEPWLLAAITGTTLETAQIFRAIRLGEDGISGTDDDAPYPDVESALARLGVAATEDISGRYTVSSGTRRVESTARWGTTQYRITGILRQGIVIRRLEQAFPTQGR